MRCTASVMAGSRGFCPQGSSAKGDAEEHKTEPWNRVWVLGNTNTVAACIATAPSSPRDERGALCSALPQARPRSGENTAGGCDEGFSVSFTLPVMNTNSPGARV